MHETHTARRATYARCARVKVSLVLKEVEMPPRLLRRVVRPAPRSSTLRARERRASLEVQEDVQPPMRRIELRPLDSPRCLQSECLLEKIDVPHDDTPPPGNPGTGRVHERGGLGRNRGPEVGQRVADVVAMPPSERSYRGEEINAGTRSLLARSRAIYPLKTARSRESCWRNARPMAAGANHCGECIPCYVRRIAIERHGADSTRYNRDAWAYEFSNLPSSDLGRRNLADLAEFVRAFELLDDDDLMAEWPELYSENVEAPQTIAMYRRFAMEAREVWARYPGLTSLLA